MIYYYRNLVLQLSLHTYSVIIVYKYFILLSSLRALRSHLVALSEDKFVHKKLIKSLEKLRLLSWTNRWQISKRLLYNILYTMMFIWAICLIKLLKKNVKKEVKFQYFTLHRKQIAYIKALILVKYFRSTKSYY